MNKRTPDILIIGIFLLLAVAAARTVITTPGNIGIEGEWDMPPYAEQVKILFSSDLHSWKSRLDYGSWSDSAQGIYFYFVLWSMASIGLDGYMISKILIVVFPAAAASFAYLFIRSFGVNHPFSAVGGAFYGFSTFMFNRISIGHLVIVWDFMLLPLGLLLFKLALKRDSNRYRYLAATILAFVVGTSHISNYPIAVAGMTFLVLLLFAESRRFTAWPLGALIIASILPIIVHGQYQDIWNEFTSSTVDARLGGIPIKFLGSSGFPLSDSIRLVAAATDYFTVVALQYPYWIYVSIFIPLLAFSALLSSRSYGSKLFFATIAMLGITITSADLSPLGNTWNLILEYVTPMRIYRVPTHWTRLAILGYAGLIALNLQGISDGIGSRLAASFQSSRVATVSSKAVMVLLLIGVTIPIGAYAVPFHDGRYGDKITPYEYDSSYRDLVTRFHNDPNLYRVVSGPAPYPSIYLDQERDSIGHDPMSHYIGKDTLYVGKVYNPPIERFLFKSFYEDKSRSLSELLALSNVEYVLYDKNKRTTSTDNTWVRTVFPDDEMTNEKFLRTLQEQSGMRLEESYGSVDLYRVEANLPRVHVNPKLTILTTPVQGLLSIFDLETHSANTSAYAFVSDHSQEQLLDLLSKNNQEIVFGPDGLTELTLALAPSSLHFDLVSHAIVRDPTTGWAPFMWTWHSSEMQGEEGYSVFAIGAHSITVPVDIMPGTYNVYARVFLGPDANQLRIKLDHRTIGSFNASLPVEAGMRWIKFGYVDSSEEISSLTLNSVGGENYVKEIVFIPQRDDKHSEIAPLLEGKNVMLYWDMPEDGFKSGENWVPIHLPYTGSGGAVLETTTSMEPAVVTGFVPKDGVYRLIIRAEAEFGDMAKSPNWLNEANLFVTILSNGQNETRHVDISGPMKSYDADLFALQEGEVTIRMAPLLQKHSRLIDRDGVFWNELGAIISRDTNTIKNDTDFSYKIVYPVGAGDDDLFHHEFDIGLDWSEHQTLSFWWYGAGTGYAMEVRLYSNSLEDRRYYEFADDFVGWKHITLSLNDPIYEQGLGVNVLNSVERIAFHSTVATPDSDKIWYLAPLTRVYTGGNVKLDIVALREDVPQLPDRRYEYERVTPAEYRLAISSGPSPVYITLAESHHDYWKISGHSGSPFVSSGYGNLFYTDQTDVVSLSLKYIREDIFQVALQISALSTAILVFIVVLPSKLRLRHTEG